MFTPIQPISAHGRERLSRGLPARAVPSVKKVCFTPKYHLGRYTRWTGLAGTLKSVVERSPVTTQ